MDAFTKGCLTNFLRKEEQRLRLFRSFMWLAMLVAALIAPLVNAHAGEPLRAEAIIVFIGDGMGLSLFRAGDIYSREAFGKSLAISTIPTVGIATTYSADSEITDSAAAATALLAGYKTHNGAINVLPDGTRVDTIAHAAKQAGMSVGMVSTAPLTDATPAALYSHSKNRRDEQCIADQLFPFAPDVALAGGLQYFVPSNVLDKSKRTDEKNWVEEFKKAGYTCVTNAEELNAVRPGEVDKLIGLFAVSQMNYELDRTNAARLQNQPSLAEMTKVALSMVNKNPKGFFLMVEGGRIDHACHKHDLKAAIYEMIAFDEAVAVALNFQKTRPDVLVLVTADHETGGLGLGRGTEYALNLMALKPITTSLEYFSDRFEKGHAELDELLKASGFELTEKERSFLLKKAPETNREVGPALNRLAKINGNVLPWVNYCLGVFESERAKVGWTSFAHTAQPVLNYAVGPGAKEFSGSYDNTDIAKKMARLLRVNLK
jgi:alkaline phosphatase